MDIFRQNLFMSDKWLLAALGLYSQSLAPSVKRELYFLSTVVLSQILGLRLFGLIWKHFPLPLNHPLGSGQWDVLIGWDYIASLSLYCGSLGDGSGVSLAQPYRLRVDAQYFLKENWGAVGRNEENRTGWAKPLEDHYGKHDIML